MTNAFLNYRNFPGAVSPGSYTTKFTRYLIMALSCVFVGGAVAESSRQVQPLTSTLTYNDGDLFLGFRATDRTSDYLINIGPPTQILNAAPGASILINVGTPTADLIATFGSDWYTRIDVNTGDIAVLWAITGGRQIAASGDPANVLYATNPGSSSWPARSDTAQSFTTSLIASLGNTFAGNNPTANNPQGLVQSAASSNSYASFQPGGGNSGGISFQAWNPANEVGPSNILFFNRIAPGACGTVLGSFSLNSNGILTFTANASPAPVGLAGSVTNCSATGSPAVSNVTFTLTGSMSSSTTSNGSGAYTFSSLPAGGNYVVTPTKTGLAPASPGISTSDVLATQGQVLLRPPGLSGCRLTAADCAGGVGVSTADVLAIQSFALGRTNPAQLGNVGKFLFTPVNRSYSSLYCSRTSENFTSLVRGDVANPFVPRPGGGSGQDSNDDSNVEMDRSVAVEVALPDVAVDESVTRANLQVSTTLIEAKDQLVGFQGDFAFDERVISFEEEAVQKAGVTKGNWNVSGNVLPGNGPVRILRVSAFSNDFTPLSGAGVLFELRMVRHSKAGQGTQLIWAASPDQFLFIDSDINYRPSNAVPGGITIEKGADKEAAQEAFNK